VRVTSYAVSRPVGVTGRAVRRGRCRRTGAEGPGVRGVGPRWPLASQESKLIGQLVGWPTAPRLAVSIMSIRMVAVAVHAEAERHFPGEAAVPSAWRGRAGAAASGVAARSARRSWAAASVTSRPDHGHREQSPTTLRLRSRRRDPVVLWVAAELLETDITGPLRS